VHSNRCTTGCFFDVDRCGLAWAGDEYDPHRRLCVLRERGVAFMDELCDVIVQHPSLCSIVSTPFFRPGSLLNSRAAHEHTDGFEIVMNVDVQECVLY
jgi:hypothetical protein